MSAGDVTLTRSDSGLETPGFSKARMRFIFDLEAPVGDLKIETY